MTFTRAAVLRRRYAGAPESLRRALLVASSDASLPRVTRRELLQALEQVDPLPPHGPGVVPFPAVAPDGDGCVYRAVAADGWRGDLTPVPPELSARVRGWLQASFPDVGTEGLHLHLSGPPPGEAWSGHSCELALALAGLSWALALAPLPGVAVSGALGEPGRVRAVEHEAEKRALVQGDLPDGALVQPGEAPIDVALDAVLPGWREARATRAARTTTRRAREALTALREQRHDVALAEAEAVLVASPEDPAALARARWVRGATLLHLGRAHEGLVDLQAAFAALPTWDAHHDDPPEDLAAEELVAWSLIALVDTGAVGAAWRLGTETLARLERAERRSRRWRWVSLQVAGSTHRAAVALGRLGEAASLLRHWALDRAVLADQRARNLGDLAEVHRRAGALPEAREALRQARVWLPDAHDPSGLTARFLELFEARADAARGRPTPPARPHAPLWPELGFKVLSARRGETDLAPLHALPAVRASLALQWVVGVEIAWHVLHDGRGARLLPGLQEDVARWEVDDAELAALLARVAADPSDEDLKAFARRCPYA